MVQSYLSLHTVHYAVHCIVHHRVYEHCTLNPAQLTAHCPLNAEHCPLYRFDVTFLVSALCTLALLYLAHKRQEEERRPDQKTR